MSLDVFVAINVKNKKEQFKILVGNEEEKYKKLDILEKILLLKRKKTKWIIYKMVNKRDEVKAFNSLVSKLVGNIEKISSNLDEYWKEELIDKENMSLKDSKYLVELKIKNKNFEKLTLEIVYGISVNHKNDILGSYIDEIVRTPYGFQLIISKTNEDICNFLKKDSSKLNELISLICKFASINVHDDGLLYIKTLEF